MRVLWALGASTILAISGCSAGGPSEDRAAKDVCSYDGRTLLPALQAAMTDDMTGRVAMHLVAGKDVIDIDGVVALRPGGAEMKMTTTTNGDQISLVVVDNRVFAAEGGPDSRFQEIEASDPVAAQLRSQAKNMNIETEFAAWNAGRKSVESIGLDSIDGQRVCHYSLVVDSAKSMAAKGQPVSPALPDSIRYELYVTADDLMRRVTFEFPGGRSEMNMTDWNEPVEIKVPATG